MEELSSTRRSILAGVLSFTAMLLIGGVSVVTAKALTPPTKQIATIQSDGLQIVDKDCVEKLNDLQRLYDNEVRALEERNRTIDAIESRYSAQQGTSIQVPEELAEHLVSPGFKTAMEAISASKRGVDLIVVHCDVYPCVAVFQSTRDNLPSTLKSAAQAQGFNWSHRWVAQGKSEHDEGSTYYGAIRFHDPKGLDTKQARFLSEGLDDVLAQAMSPGLTTD